MTTVKIEKLTPSEAGQQRLTAYKEDPKAEYVRISEHVTYLNIVKTEALGDPFTKAISDSAAKLISKFTKLNATIESQIQDGMPKDDKLLSKMLSTIDKLRGNEEDGVLGY